MTPRTFGITVICVAAVEDVTWYTRDLGFALPSVVLAVWS